MGNLPNKGSLGEESMVCTRRSCTRGGLAHIYVRDDAKTISIIALGCFHPNVKVQSASLHFFQGTQEEENSSDEDDEVRLKLYVPLY